MQQFAKPENALKRADELCNVGQKENALVALHDVLSSKRHRMWQPAIEDVILRFIDLCVELRKGKAAKDGLIQYRFICQQINVASMESVLRHFMELADKATQAALESAEKLISDKVANLLDFDDLEAEETPESLMLATIGGSTDSKKRTDRQIVTPSLKFLWESFRTVLDILRNNTKLEDLYREATARAFGFCKKYKRSVEFRRLCEMLRNHIQSQTRVDPKWKDREPPTPESYQMHLETRFAQLDTAIEMELWQEAYRTVEDVHMLLQQMKKTPKPASMVAYHAQLGKVFWVADNRLFHAYAISRQLTISKTQKTPPGPEETERIASRAVLAMLAIPPASPVLDVNLLEYDLEHEKTKRMAQMLSFPLTASRAMLMEEVKAKGILAAAAPEVRQLCELIEQPMPPLDLAIKVAPVLATLAEDENYKQYDKALRELVGLRMLQQMERIYLTIKIEHVAKAIPLLSWQQIETLILWAVKKELLTLRIDYKHARLNQQPAKADAAASSEVRDSLSRFASALDAVDRNLRSTEIGRRKAEVRTRLYGSIEAGVEAEHQKILSRRLIIERRKEEQERVTMEEEKERARLKHIKQREEEAEERARLATEARRRDAEREEKERVEEEQVQMRKLAEQMAEQRKAMKVTKKKGGDPSTKVETSVEKLAEKDRNELMREQRELMMDERAEFEKRLESMSKRHDHMERARREEERELLLARYKTQQAEDEKAHAEQAALEVERRKSNREHDLKEKARFTRMSAAAQAFNEGLMAKKRDAHVLVVAQWREDQARRREEARREKEEEEAAARAHEEEIENARREAEEEEARRIQEAAEAARVKKEAEEERLRVAERQRLKEKELEEKQRQAEIDKQTARMAEREKKGTSWAVEDEDDELPAVKIAWRPGEEEQRQGGAERRFERGPPRGGPDDGGWQSHRMGGGPDRAGPDRGSPRDGPDRGGDRWERVGDPRGAGFERRDDRGPPPPRGDDRAPPMRGGGFEPRGDRGPPRGDDRGPPVRGAGFEPRGPPRGDDRGPRGDDRGPPMRGGGFEPRGDRGPPRGDDRGPPMRGAGFEPRGPPRGDDRGPPRRDGGDRGDDRGPPMRGAGFEPRGPPRGGGDDRGPPRRDDRRGPPREGGNNAGGGGSWRR